jgi:tetrapyrrole methylase family protein / MazG family protein
VENSAKVAFQSAIDSLIRLIETLRSENGCPWDRKQSPKTMAGYMTEEAYELVDAVASEEAGHVCEELGDVLFHVLFIAHLYSEKGAFGLHDVVSGILDKMIRRHPHVFGSAQADTPEAVKKQWNIIKAEERGHASPQSILDGVPAGLPPLLRAFRVSEKAAGIGFDWEDLSGVMEKVLEEWGEFQRETQGMGGHSDAKHRAAMEFGDLLFTLTNVARIAGFHPDTALVSATQKFETRFRKMEALAAADGQLIGNVSRDQLENWWNQVKSEPEVK